MLAIDPSALLLAVGTWICARKNERSLLAVIFVAAACAGVATLLIIAVVIPTTPRAAIASTKNIVVLINFIRRILYKKIYRK
jgi:hydrogenase/urease accessory protein HupE